jgi:hypothetical protein
MSYSLFHVPGLWNPSTFFTGCKKWRVRVIELLKIWFSGTDENPALGESESLRTLDHFSHFGHFSDNNVTKPIWGKTKPGTQGPDSLLRINIQHYLRIICTHKVALKSLGTAFQMYF